MANRRIHDLEDTATTLDSGAYIAVDSDSYTAAKKFAADSLATASHTHSVEPIIPPAAFDNGRIPINVYRNDDVYQAVGLNFDTYRNLATGTIKYVDGTSGSDSNAGTAAAPYGSVSKALTEGAAIVYIKPGTYYRNITVGGSAKNFTCTSTTRLARWPGETGEVLLTSAENISSWTNDATYTNTYTCTRSSTYKVVDITDTDAYGHYPAMTLAASAAECNTTAGSYYVTGSTVYVRTHDDRAPDDDVLVLVIENIITAAGHLSLILENITFIGGAGRTLRVYNTQSGEIANVYANGCIFSHSYNDDAFEHTGGDVILIDCMACYANRDGFNYHAGYNVSAFVIEINCTAYDCGLDDANDNNNASTAHETSKIIRVGGTYTNTKGPVVGDVDTSTAWLVGCTISSSASAGAGGDIGYLGATSWLDGCAVSDSAIDIYGSTMVYLRNTTYSTTDGTVTTY